MLRWVCIVAHNIMFDIYMRFVYNVHLAMSVENVMCGLGTCDAWTGDM